MKIKKSEHLHGLLSDERGLTTVEYIIILCLIAVVGFAIWRKFGETVKEKVGGADQMVGTLPTDSAP
ncbi:MAG: Flp family type IVb pilin [Sandaracinaceae bacterium]